MEFHHKVASRKLVKLRMGKISAHDLQLAILYEKMGAITRLNSDGPAPMTILPTREARVAYILGLDDCELEGRSLKGKIEHQERALQTILRDFMAWRAFAPIYEGFSKVDNDDAVSQSNFLENSPFIAAARQHFKEECCDLLGPDVYAASPQNPFEFTDAMRYFAIKRS